MKQQTNYSDEHISAYIDGELDHDERTLLLFDEQNDAGLAQRINEARMLKEKVQLTYAEIVNANDANRPFSCRAFASNHRALVAGFLLVFTVAAALTYNLSTYRDLSAAKQLIVSTQPIEAEDIKTAIGNDQHIVIHISQYEKMNFGQTIEHIELLLEQHETDSTFSVELVANGQGLRALDTTSSIHAERLSSLADRFDSLQVIACAKSLAMLATDGDPVQLIKSIIITPSAAQQIDKRTRQGWSYIKI